MRKFMSTSPVTIGPAALRGEALAMMRAKRIHHMPVIEGGRVVGLVTEGDLVELAPGSDAKANVKTLMRPKPYMVSPESPVDEVVREMATHRYGSAAVVVDNGRVVGMFTATDGLHAFAEFLRPAR